MADDKQIEKIVPLITCEIPFCQYVCKLVFGVDMLDLNFGVQVDSVKQPVKSNSVGSGYVSHCWTSAYDDASLSSQKRRTSHRIEKTSRSMKHGRHCSIQDCRAELESWFGFGVFS